MQKTMWISVYVVILLLVCNGLAIAETGYFEIRKVNERTLEVSTPVMRLNMAAFDYGPGVLVVDTFVFPHEAAAARKIIEEHFGKKVTHVVLTHHHWDHSFGAAAFKDCTIIGHTTCLEDMKADYATPKGINDRVGRLESSINNLVAEVKKSGRLTDEDMSLVEKTRAAGKNPAAYIEVVFPDTLFERKETLALGDLEFVLYHEAGLHTRSFVAVHVPALHLIVTRSTFVADEYPEFEGPVDIDILVSDFREMLATDPGLSTLLQGHGPGVTGTTFDLRIGYLEKLQKAVHLAKDAGISLEKALEQAGLSGISDENHRNNINTLKDSYGI